MTELRSCRVGGPVRAGPDPGRRAALHQAEDDRSMVPHEPGTGVGGVDHPCFNSWVYGADVVLPIIDFGQDTAWRPVESDDVGADVDLGPVGVHRPGLGAGLGVRRRLHRGGAEAV